MEHPYQNYPPQFQQNQPQPTQDEKTWALLSHGGFIIGGFLVPLIIWLVKKEESAYVSHHAKAALNWQLSVLIAIIPCVILMIVYIGFLLVVAVAVINLVFGIMGMINASNGVWWNYPFSIPLIR